MQKVNAGSQVKDSLDEELKDEAGLVNTIVEAHKDTCDYTKVVGRPQVTFVQNPPRTACLLNPAPHRVGNGDPRYLEDFFGRFEPAINEVVEFAKRIPGFRLLSQEDQKTLTKAGLFEVLLVRYACKSNSKPDYLLNQNPLRWRSLHVATRMKALNLSETEISLFCAVVVMTDRPGLRNTDLVLKVQEKITNILRKLVTVTHENNLCFFHDLMTNIDYLKTLNIEHTKQLLTYKVEPRNKRKSSQLLQQKSLKLP